VKISIILFIKTDRCLQSKTNFIFFFKFRIMTAFACLIIPILKSQFLLSAYMSVHVRMHVLSSSDLVDKEVSCNYRFRSNYNTTVYKYYYGFHNADTMLL